MTLPNAINIAETKGYKQTLTVVPTHETAWEVWYLYKKHGINAEVYPQLAICKNKDCCLDVCWRYKYKDAGACIKGICKYYKAVKRALNVGFSPSETICPRCDQRNECQYHRRRLQAEKAEHRICTNNRFKLSHGRIAENVDYVTIHEEILDTLRPAIIIPSGIKIVKTVEALKIIIAASAYLSY